MTDNNLNDDKKLGIKNPDDNKEKTTFKKKQEGTEFKLKNFKTFIPTGKRKWYFGNDKIKTSNYNYKFTSNAVTTTKYNLFTWIPKSLLFQFMRAANIYFLIIAILSALPFSPKSPVSNIGTFALVLIFTMLKEGYEDLKRAQQDKVLNDKKAYVYDFKTGQYSETSWRSIKVGQFVKIRNEEEIPCDLVMFKTSLDSGLAFLDTMNLDGETNLKEKMMNSTLKKVPDSDLYNLKGKFEGDRSNENLEKWQATLAEETLNTNIPFEMNNLLLRGCKLRNTEYIIGVVAYTGHSTKIMKNSKNPPIKVSNLMKVMNYILYSIFAFQLGLCVAYSLFYIIWQHKQGNEYVYLQYYEPDGVLSSPGQNSYAFFIKFLTFIVAFSHLVPISLYVSLEMVKLIQVKLIQVDDDMYDIVTEKYAQAKTSDLIEELGQVEFIFSDKTGTLTKNEMIFRKCLVNAVVYGKLGSPDYEKDETEKPTFAVNGETNCFKELTSGSSENQKCITDFWTVCSVCHSAYVENKNGVDVFQSSSPDEVALILGAKDMGFTLKKKTTSTIEINIDRSDKYQIWETFMEIPFDSDRKRMSVVVKGEDSKYYLLTKGADATMLNKIIGVEEQVMNKIKEDLEGFARECLRTLVLAKKEVTLYQVNEWLRRVEEIKAQKAKSGDDDFMKTDPLIEYYHIIESDLQYVGSTGIEDKLQDNVDSTIENLMNAKIRFWVLTGDKKETAIEIGKSCKIVVEGMDQIDLTSNPLRDDSLEEAKYKLTQVFNKYYDPKEMNEINLKKKYTENNLIMHPKNFKNKLYLIIDGKNLIHILADEILSRQFFRVGLLCNSVICCRVSPKQKAEVVGLAKRDGNWITLSIGDGANDVPMIMTAHIGVGIAGKEGTQAVRSSDYALGQFQFLRKILFVHGRWAYRKISYFILYFFYKNILLVLVELYFSFWSGFSGQIFYPDMLPLLFNAFFTSWPCMFSYVIERDVDADLSMKNPILYRAGQIKFYFNLIRFWTWIGFAIIQATLIYFGVIYGSQHYISNDGFVNDHWFKSTIAFSVIIHVIVYKIFLELGYWNVLNM